MNRMMKLLMRIGLPLMMLITGGFPMLAGAIHAAADRGDVANVAIMLRDDSTLIESRDEEGMTPIHYAALNGRGDLVRMFIERGANLNALDAGGQTAVHYAVIFHNTEAIHLLIDAGASPDMADTAGQTPLYLAAINGFGDIMVLLIGSGARVNLRDDGGRTPLYGAATYGQKSGVMILLAAHADPAIADELGATPLVMARAGHFSEIEAILMRSGAPEMPVTTRLEGGIR